MRELFDACDLDGNGYLESDEFSNMIQCIEPKMNRKSDIIKLFEDYSDSYEIFMDDNKLTIRGMIL